MKWARKCKDKVSFKKIKKKIKESSKLCLSTEECFLTCADSIYHQSLWPSYESHKEV
jgi:hypothetical protein